MTMGMSQAQWSFILWSYLMDGAQEVLRALSKEQTSDYNTLKSTMLDWYEITSQ